MKTLWFVTPVHRRYELTDVCLQQRRWACNEIQYRYGLNAQCVVVGDDENLEAALQQGFHVVEQNNDWLGRKFNDGYEYAAEHGADYLFAIGSDSFIVPQYFRAMPELYHVAMSRHLCEFRYDGQERLDLKVAYPNGYGVALTIPTQLFSHVNYRPCDDRINSGCDSSTWNRAWPTPPARAFRTYGNPFEYINFQSPDIQVTNYDHLLKWGTKASDDDIWAPLYCYYPNHLVDAVRDVYGLPLHTVGGILPVDPPTPKGG